MVFTGASTSTTSSAINPQAKSIPPCKVCAALYSPSNRTEEEQQQQQGEGTVLEKGRSNPFLLHKHINHKQVINPAVYVSLVKNRLQNVIGSRRMMSPHAPDYGSMAAVLPTLSDTRPAQKRLAKHWHKRKSSSLTTCVFPPVTAASEGSKRAEASADGCNAGICPARNRVEWNRSSALYHRHHRKQSHFIYIIVKYISYV